MNKSDKIYVAGHRGMVGSAILRKLKAEGFTNLITSTSSEVD
ncbi:MAG: NAD-dependent epimerase/dehydratase family protein, partial [Mameliella sp.]|nr:NAD-dependent epimerase/dehydratase family protein [Phaeodactylibacter sp.]